MLFPIGTGADAPCRPFAVRCPRAPVLSKCLLSRHRRCKVMFPRQHSWYSNILSDNRSVRSGTYPRIRFPRQHSWYSQRSIAKRGSAGARRFPWAVIGETLKHPLDMSQEIFHLSGGRVIRVRLLGLRQPTTGHSDRPVLPLAVNWRTRGGHTCPECFVNPAVSPPPWPPLPGPGRPHLLRPVWHSCSPSEAGPWC